MAKKILSFILAACFFISVSGCSTYMKHPEFAERHKTLQSVAAMPPEVEIYRLTFKGDKEIMHDLIDEASVNIKDEIEELFAKKGYEVKKLDLSESVLSSKPALRTALFNIRKLFNERLEDIRKRAQKKFTYTLGADINEFSHEAGSDVLVFTRCDGFKKSGGEITKDITKSILIAAATLGSVMVFYYAASTVLHVAVVDGDNGDILWYNTNVRNPNIDSARKKQLKGTVRGLFRKFPDRVCYLDSEDKDKAVFDEEIEKERAIEREIEAELEQEVYYGNETEEEAEESVISEEAQEPPAAAEEPAEEIESPPAATQAAGITVEVVSSDGADDYYTGAVKEEIESYLMTESYLGAGEVWFKFDIVTGGLVKNLTIIEEKSTGSSSMKKACIDAVNACYPFMPLPDDTTKVSLVLKATSS